MTPFDQWELLQHRCLAKGWPWWTAAYDLNVIGLRAASAKAGPWDDAIVVAYRTHADVRVERFAATTDPGRPWLERPMRAAGCAVPIPGHYRRLWRRGIHGSPGYPALVQVGAIAVWRDPDRNGVLVRTGPVFDDASGIDLHHGSDTDGEVGLHSAGCQVVRARASLSRILELVAAQAANGHGETVSYGLFDVGDEPELAPLLEGVPGRAA